MAIKTLSDPMKTGNFSIVSLPEGNRNERILMTNPGFWRNLSFRPGQILGSLKFQEVFGQTFGCKVAENGWKAGFHTSSEELR